MSKNSTTYNAVPLEVSVQLRVLHQECGYGIAKLQKKFPDFPKTTIYRHMKKPIGNIKPDKRKNSCGAPHKLSQRNQRQIMRSMNTLMNDIGTFSSVDLQKHAGLVGTCSNRTVRRFLNKNNYGYYQCRKKGQMTPEDLEKRLLFCKKCKQLPDDFWEKGISFYLDGTGFAHKTNPCMNARTTRTRMWRKRGEGLKRKYTAKGKKEGTGGRVARFMVAITHGKGVIKCYHYNDHINAEKFADFVREHFPEMFKAGNNSMGKLFLQDGDPSQNSRMALDAMDAIPCRLFKIPARSPDLNPIENVFHLVGKQLRQDAMDKNITKETFDQFCYRIKKTLLNFSPAIISRTIESMNKRVNAIISSKGERIKY